MTQQIVELETYLREQVAAFRYAASLSTCPDRDEGYKNNTEWADKLESWAEAVEKLKGVSE